MIDAFFVPFKAFAAELDAKTTALLQSVNGERAPDLGVTGASFLTDVHDDLMALSRDANELDRALRGSVSLRDSVQALRLVVGENQAGLNQLVATLEQYGYVDQAPPPVSVDGRVVPSPLADLTDLAATGPAGAGAGDTGADDTIQLPQVNLEGLGISSATLAMLSEAYSGSSAPSVNAGNASGSGSKAPAPAEATDTEDEYEREEDGEEDEEVVEDDTEIVVQVPSSRKCAAASKADGKEKRDGPRSKRSRAALAEPLPPSIAPVSPSEYGTLPEFLRDQLSERAIADALESVNAIVGKKKEGSRITQADVSTAAGVGDKTKALLLVLTTLKRLYRKFEGGKTVYSLQK